MLRSVGDVWKIRGDKAMKVKWDKNTFAVLPTIIIVPKKYALKKRTYVCFTWLYWWIDLVY